MADSPVKIANLALSQCGAERINSFEDPTPSARAIKDTYNDTLDSLLEEHMWSFAQKRVLLSEVAEPPAFTTDLMKHVYAKPGDLVKINFINLCGAIWKPEGNRILCDQANLGIWYTFRNLDPSSYTAKFTEALEMKLAHKLCFRLTESVAKPEKIYEAYEKIFLPRAIASDSQQGTPMEPMQDEWLSAMHRDSGGLIGVPGNQTWFPAW